MNANENTIPRKYKRCDEAFQRSTVEHWMLSGKSARQVALELGLNVQSLQNWKQPFKALQAENRRLQKELHRVAQQRDILKKPWA